MPGDTAEHAPEHASERDPTLHRSPVEAMAATPEQLAYVALLEPDAIAVVDVAPASPTYGTTVGQWDAPPHATPDEFHHYGWNICSSALGADHHHTGVMERRYLVVPGLRSSRIYVLDTGDDPRHPRLVRTIEPEEVIQQGHYSRPHTIHCGPHGLFVSALGAGTPDGTGGPAGIFTVDHSDFSVTGQWELEHGSQYLAYDFWWHLGTGVLVSSEWAQPPLFERGVVPEALLGRQYGHRLHFFDLAARKHVAEVDLGDQYQMALEVRPAHDPAAAYGFVGVVVDVSDLSGAVFTWYKDGPQWKARKTIEIPAVPLAADKLPPLLAGFGAAPPIITDIGLSLNDQYLYVACWATGEIRQYDVSDPFSPKHTGTVALGGIPRHTAHASGAPWAGGPQMLEVSRDGKRVYTTNSLYSSWDRQFYPEGVPGAMAIVDALPGGGLEVNANFHPRFPGHRAHQVRLEGGDCSSDSFCFSR